MSAPHMRGAGKDNCDTRLISLAVAMVHGWCYFLYLGMICLNNDLAVSYFKYLKTIVSWRKTCCQTKEKSFICISYTYALHQLHPEGFVVD